MRISIILLCFLFSSCAVNKTYEREYKGCHFFSNHAPKQVDKVKKHPKRVKCFEF